VLEREHRHRWTIERYVSIELGERGCRIHVAGWTLFVVTGLPRDQERDEYEAIMSFVDLMGPKRRGADPDGR
jgi:hypothetical protein